MLRRLYRRLRHKPVPPPIPITLYDGELLRGQRALVTGASGKLGPAMIQALRNQQAEVIFTDMSEERCQLLESEFPGSYGIVADIGETDKILTALGTHGDLPDILVNNLGIAAEKSFWNETHDDWQQVFQTNIFAPVRLTKAIAERMVTQKKEGSIVFITSVHQHLPSRWPSYSASKAALSMVIKELAVALAPHNIRVNGVAPGWSQAEDCYFRMALLENRTIDPTYVAHAVLFLGCTALSRFTTGTVLTVDAGMSLYSGRTVIQPPQERTP